MKNALKSVPFFNFAVVQRADRRADKYITVFPYLCRKKEGLTAGGQPIAPLRLRAYAPLQALWQQNRDALWAGLAYIFIIVRFEQKIIWLDFVIDNRLFELFSSAQKTGLTLVNSGANGGNSANHYKSPSRRGPYSYNLCRRRGLPYLCGSRD